MRPLLLPTAFSVLALLASGAGPASDPGAPAEEAVRRTVSAARGIALDDRAVVLAELDFAEAAAAQAALDAGGGAPPTREWRRWESLLRMIERARDAAEDAEASPRRVASLLRAAARRAYAARRLTPCPPGEDFDVRVTGWGFGRAGRRLTVRLVARKGSEECAEIEDAAVANDGPGVAVEPEFEDLGRGRLRLHLGPDAGAATLSITACGIGREVRIYNLGPKGSPSSEPGWGEDGAAPGSIAYPQAEVSWRAGAEAPSFLADVVGGHPAEFAFSVEPALPGGLALDPATGAISGIPTEEAFAADYEVTAANLHGSVSTTVRIEVTPALPPEVEFLVDGFAVAPWLEGLSIPVKMAVAPDGRLFFNELVTGNVRVVDADGALIETPFATVTVQTGVERGLLGLALAPDFATSGHLYVYGTVPADDPQPVRGQVIRFTADGDVGTDPTVIVDDLPAGLVHNGGDLQFGPDGKLYLSLGDTGDSSLAQADGERAGRVLRFEPDGSIPSDNAIPGDPEWCRGLRNPFDIAFHGPTGGLFGTENGPAAGDELNLLLGGRNYAWETLPEGFPPHLIGPRIAYWGPVIVPTGLAFHSGANFGAAFEGDLFLCAYDDADLRRFVLSGSSHADVDSQTLFARWDDTGGVDNKPLDAVELPDGTLLVSTFSGIWRIDRFAARQP